MILKLQIQFVKACLSTMCIDQIDTLPSRRRKWGADTHTQDFPLEEVF